MDEEVVLLEEQLTVAQGDIERLQSQLADSEARSASRDQELAQLRRQLEGARSEVAERDASLAALAQEFSVVRSSLADSDQRSREAASRYRDLLLAREPELPADLVVGETVVDLDESLARARQTVAQVRQHIEQQAQGLRVPAGAPTRGSPDTSALTPAEKIRLGLQRE